MLYDNREDFVRSGHRQEIDLQKDEQGEDLSLADALKPREKNVLHVTWSGAAGLRFDTNKMTVLIDPYYTRIGIWLTLFRPIEPDKAAIDQGCAGLKKLNGIIVSHTHLDHALDVPYLAAKYGSIVVGSTSLDNLMQMHRLFGRAEVCHGGETVTLKDSASVTMIRSIHGAAMFNKVPFSGEISSDRRLPLKAKDYRVGTVFNAKLSIDGKVFLHTGSAGFIAKELLGHTCDVLCLCATGWQKCKGYPELLVEMTRPKAIILFHYDDISNPHQNGERTKQMPLINLKGLIQRIKNYAPAVELVIPEIGEVMTF